MSSVKSYNNGSVNTSAYPVVNTKRPAPRTAVNPPPARTVNPPPARLSQKQQLKEQELSQVLAAQKQEEKEREETARATAEAISNSSTKKYLAIGGVFIAVVALFVLLWIFYIKNTASGKDALASSDGAKNCATSSGNFANSYGKSSK